jgi:hypothetical protein
VSPIKLFQTLLGQSISRPLQAWCGFGPVPPVETG